MRKREVKYTLRMHFARSTPYDMTAEELRRMIGEETIADIKLSDPNPFFKAWVALHEGPAFPQIVGPQKKKMVVFTRAAVKSAASAIKAGLKRGMKFILGHNETGAQAPETGRVVAMKDIQMQDGRSAMVVAGYFPPDEIQNAEKAHAVSIEGVIEFVEHAGKYVANIIRDITDIALLTKEEPGLPGAVALATLRASKNKDGTTVDGETVFEMKEIRRWIRQNNYRVEDFFEPDEIVGRRIEVNGKIEYQNAPAPVKRVLDELEGKFGETVQVLNAEREKTAKEAEAFKWSSTNPSRKSWQPLRHARCRTSPSKRRSLAFSLLSRTSRQTSTGRSTPSSTKCRRTMKRMCACTERRGWLLPHR
jgi:hypothetical protein